MGKRASSYTTQKSRSSEKNVLVNVTRQFTRACVSAHAPSPLFAGEACETNRSLKSCWEEDSRDSFALFATISQVSACGASPTNARSVCVLAFRVRQLNNGANLRRQASRTGDYCPAHTSMQRVVCR